MRSVNFTLITSMINNIDWGKNMSLNSIDIHVNAISELLTATVTFQLEEYHKDDIEYFLKSNLEGDGIEYNYKVVESTTEEYLLVINIIELP